MRSEQDDKGFLWDMIDAAQAIQEFVDRKTLEEYLEDRMLRGAVERHLEIIGEAARRISEKFKEAHLEIPWRLLIGQRNILAHEYGEVRHEVIWKVAKERIPELINRLRTIMPPDTEDK